MVDLGFEVAEVADDVEDEELENEGFDDDLEEESGLEASVLDGGLQGEAANECTVGSTSVASNEITLRNEFIMSRQT